MVDDATQIEASWLEGKTRIGVTAGASAPEVLVRAVLDQLRSYGAGEVRELPGIEENVVFALPKNLIAEA